MSQRWALLLQYDGTEFAGSQWQPNRPTVQGALQDALTSLIGARLTVSLAGRTDAGVHATGQVASFASSDDAHSMSAARWVRGLNHFLPDSIAVQDAAPVSDAFDPRRDAVSRTYEYTLRVSAQRQPLWRRRAWTVAPPFRVELARGALSALLGEHDFAAFTPPTSDRSTRRLMLEAALRTSPMDDVVDDVAPDGSEIRITLRADAFLQRQVRRIVGATVEVARGRLGLQEFCRAFTAAVPGSMGPTAPAQGLALTMVEYDPPPFSTARRTMPTAHTCQRASQQACPGDREGD